MKLSEIKIGEVVILRGELVEVYGIDREVKHAPVCLRKDDGTLWTAHQRELTPFAPEESEEKRGPKPPKKARKAMPDTVLYHGNCLDGFCAAWLVHQCIDQEIERIPVQYGQDPPWEAIDSKSVWILDFSYKRPVLEEIARRVNQREGLVVLDHHKTAEEELAGFEYCVFDMDKSGARITWEFLFDNGFTRERECLGVTCSNPHWLVRYTEDRDLWRWQLPDSREVTAALRSYPLDFDLWDEWLREGKQPADFISEGEAILRYQASVVETHVRHAREIELCGHKILTVNATTLFSEIAGELARGRPFGAAYFDRGDGLRQWSLRSSEEGVDVADIARSMGGGGHRNAAGFEQKI